MPNPKCTLTLIWIDFIIIFKVQKFVCYRLCFQTPFLFPISNFCSLDRNGIVYFSIICLNRKQLKVQIVNRVDDKYQPLFNHSSCQVNVEDIIIQSLFSFKMDSFFEVQLHLRIDPLLCHSLNDPGLLLNSWLGCVIAKYKWFCKTAK